MNIYTLSHTHTTAHSMTHVMDSCCNQSLILILPIFFLPQVSKIDGFQTIVVVGGEVDWFERIVGAREERGVMYVIFEENNIEENLLYF